MLSNPGTKPTSLIQSASIVNVEVTNHFAKVKLVVPAGEYGESVGLRPVAHNGGQLIFP